MAEITIQLKKVKKLAIQAFLPSAFCLLPSCTSQDRKAEALRLNQVGIQPLNTGQLREALQTFEQVLGIVRAVEQQMEKARIIHLATHGLLDDFKGQGVPGAIALAPDSQTKGEAGKINGLLTLSEILD